MLRRDIRLRRDYLYRKSLEGKKKEEYEKKMKVREALACLLYFSGVSFSWEAGSYRASL